MATKKGKTEVDDLTRLDLRVNLLLKENNDLKSKNLDIQGQLIEANAKSAALEVEVQRLKLQQVAKDTQTNLQDSLTTVQEAYGIDLSKDKINLETGLITRVEDTPAEEKPPAAATEGASE